MPGPQLQFLSKYQSGVRHDPEIQASRHPPKQSSSGHRNPSSGPLCPARHRPPGAPVLPTSVHEAATTAPGQEAWQPEGCSQGCAPAHGVPRKLQGLGHPQGEPLVTSPSWRRTLSCPQYTASPACSTASRASSPATPPKDPKLHQRPLPSHFPEHPSSHWGCEL